MSAGTAAVELPRRTGAIRRPRPIRLGLSLLCVVIGAIYFIPLVWTLSLSVRGNRDVFSNRVLPHSFRPSNYMDAWSNLGLGILFEHTIIITIGTVLFATTLSVTAAYGFARHRSRVSETVFLVILLGLMVPPAGVIITFFVTMRQLHLYNSLIAVIIGETAFALPLAILLLRGYVESIPIDLTDAARVDGASDWKAFWYVAFPLLKPAVATVALFTTIATWNDFLLPLVLMADPQRSTLTVGLSQLASQYGAFNEELVSAAAILATIPVLVVFIVARRYYVKGLSAGAIKQ
jgi:ABC-type glycerol-3-phosphate transport system permease component